MASTSKGVQNGIIELQELEKAYPPGFRLYIPYLSFERGGIYAIVGPNGSGKTTFLNILSLLLRPTKGKILFESQDVYKSHGKLTEYRNLMTLVAQNPFLFRGTLFKNAAYGLKVRKTPGDVIEERVSKCLAMVGLSGFEKRAAQTLSGGEIQRAAIARAICVRPQVLFLDEPTANVDSKNVHIIEELMRDINEQEKTTVIFTTHDSSQARSLSREVILLSEGKMARTEEEEVIY